MSHPFEIDRPPGAVCTPTKVRRSAGSSGRQEMRPPGACLSASRHERCEWLAGAHWPSDGPEALRHAPCGHTSCLPSDPAPLGIRRLRGARCLASCLLIRRQGSSWFPRRTRARSFLTHSPLSFGHAGQDARLGEGRALRSRPSVPLAWCSAGARATQECRRGSEGIHTRSFLASEDAPSGVISCSSGSVLSLRYLNQTRSGRPIVFE